MDERNSFRLNKDLNFVYSKNFFLLSLNTDVKFLNCCKKILEENFIFSIEVTNITETTEVPLEGDKIVIDDCFSLFNRKSYSNTHLFLINAYLLTSFGKRIISETRDNLIVISSKIAVKNLERVIKHEVGHMLGLSHHLNCVMAPYYYEGHEYCDKCKIIIKKYLRDGKLES